MAKIFQWIGIKKNQNTLIFLVSFVSAILGVYFAYQKGTGPVATKSSNVESNPVLPEPVEAEKGKAKDMSGTGSQQSSRSSGGGISINADRGASVNITK